MYPIQAQYKELTVDQILNQFASQFVRVSEEGVFHGIRFNPSGSGLKINSFDPFEC